MAVGKLVRGALYVHRDALNALAKDERAMIDKAVAIAGPIPWNVGRIQKHAVGLLEYENFDDAAFPRLFASTRVNVATGENARMNFNRSANPLILHRKELLLLPQDPRVGRWAERTRLLVGKGLFEDSHAIGRQRAWNERLARAGLSAVGDDLVPA